VTPRLRVALIEASRRRPPISGAEIERRTDRLVSRSTVSSIVRGKQDHLSYDRLVAIARVLGVDPSTLADVSLPQEWKLPAEFESVPIEDRAEAQHVLAWMLAIRRRRSD
jgi:transcriptional regulator with XRE-family HTH domain